MSFGLAASVVRLLQSSELRQLSLAVAERRAVTATGLWGSSTAAVVSAIRNQLNRPVVVVCGHLDETDDFADDMNLFGGTRPMVLGAVETGSALGRASEEQVADRLRAIALLATSKDQPDVVVSIQALMQAVPTKDELKFLLREITAGEMLEPEKLIVWLSSHGYNRLDQVEVPGDFAVRGGIIDIYLPGQIAGREQLGLPVRVDFFGDQIESIKIFDTQTLGSADVLLTVAIPDISGKPTSSTTSLFGLLKPDTIVVFNSPLEIAEQAKSFLDRVAEQRGMYPLGAILRAAAPFSILELSQFEQSAGSGAVLIPASNGEAKKFTLPVRSVQRFETDVKKSMVELAEVTENHRVSLFCENAAEAQRFGELMQTHAPQAVGKVIIERGYLHRGFVWGIEGSSDHLDLSLPHLFLPHHELFHRYEVRRRVGKKTSVASKTIDSFLDLQSGDYVVHIAHGIAKFTGMHTVTKDGKSEEYLTLRFADGASLHVPASRINLVQKYVGGFDGHPQLSRLGSGSWEKQKERVSEAVMDMAAELLEVQASRAAEQGTAFPSDTPWQTEFEAEFRYTPTADQVTSNIEIKSDLQRPRPMDRLLCGDVGYGKTEMAMRAAFKVAEFGKQVAVLVPTTILAEQHERSFRERFADYPLTIESVSRFKTGKELKAILGRLERGELDIIIGTHRLLSQDVKFADLGLVVVDEEQRFGVTHKERLKKIRALVDVLTMSATPIPRTLHMSMVGLRDISSLTTAPQDRRSIVTEVVAFDPERVKMAIQRELAREGQVYIVHNRIGDIEEFAARIHALVPDARIVIGHGQMDEHQLEDVMLRFIRHDADILVSTTIIESGLDIPNANTMLIDGADQYGLSQLHQLRGRVGRYKHRAYCYMLLPSDRPITPVAAKRLKAIEEYSHLGAGFKIAMRDLEIRGAGNILGPEQSGHIAAVGYELYCQLLEEATQQLKNGKKDSRPEAHIELGVSAFIPSQYIAADRQRMDIYRRLTRCGALEQVAELEQHMRDAFGEPPRQVMVLIAITELRLLGTLFGIDSVIKKDPDIVMKVSDAAKAQVALTGAPGRLTVVDASTVYLRMPPTFLEPEAALLTLRNLLKKAWQKQAQPAATDLPKIQEQKPDNKLAQAQGRALGSTLGQPLRQAPGRGAK